MSIIQTLNSQNNGKFSNIRKGEKRMFYQPELNISPDEVLIYLRKSRSDDPTLTVEEVLQKHETMLDEWSEKYLHGKIPEENRFREVVSGETIEDRPEIKKVLKLIESPKYKAVLVVEVQRLSRGDLEDAGRIIKLFRYTNTLVLSIQKNYDIRDEYDRDMFERELKRGNEFLEYTKRIMNNGKLLSVSQGNYIGSIPPYGYDRTTVQEGKRKCPTLKINEKEAQVVRMIFDMYVNQDMGRVNIAHRLNELKIKPRKEGLWSQDRIKGILENYHYIGKVFWNFRKTITTIEDGEVVKSRPTAKIGEFLIYDGKHEPIVSNELFYAAREKQGRNHRAKPTTKIRNPLAGLLYCQCGRAMSLRTHKKAQRPPRLVCDNQVYCKTTSCLYDEMIDRVCEVLEQCIEDFEIRIQNDDQDSRKLHTNLIKQMEAKLTELNKKEISQWEKYSEEGMPKHIFDSLNEKVLREKEEINQALCKAKQTMPDPVDYEEKLHRFRDALEALKDPEVSPARKNRLLKACIDRIDYSREKSVRLKREPGEKKGTRFTAAGGYWDTPSFEIDVKLRV